MSAPEYRRPPLEPTGRPDLLNEEGKPMRSYIRTEPHTREQIAQKYFISPRMSSDEMDAAIHEIFEDSN